MTRVSRSAIVLAVLLLACAAVPAQTRRSDLGPAIQSYLEFLDSEAAELRYYLDGGEMPPAEYRVAKDRLDVTREFAVRLARQRADDLVPELLVLKASELTQVLPEGLAALKGKRAGATIDDVWTFHGSARKSELFYVLERTASIAKAPSS
jgi:hypothetical protein